MGNYYRSRWAAHGEIEKLETEVDVYETPFATDKFSFKTIPIRLKEAKKWADSYKTIYWTPPIGKLHYDLYCTPWGWVAR